MKYKACTVPGTGSRLPASTLRYLELGAGEGERNNALFHAVCQFRDNGLSREEAEERCLARAIADGLGESEARSTFRSAWSSPPRDPVGTKPAAAARACTGPAGSHSKAMPSASSAPPAPMPLPEPLTDGLPTLLRACFTADEFVSIADTFEDEEGQRAPKSGVTLRRDEWLERITRRGSINRIFSTKEGLFVRVNPMRQNGTTNEDVTALRHVLVEFDTDGSGQNIPKEVQYASIVSSRMPVSAIIDSGNKSIHAWVCVDAPDLRAYKQRVEVIWKFFQSMHLDEKNKNPSRYSRCPDGRRTVEGEVREQRLLATDIGLRSWTEWEEAAGAATLPAIIPGPVFMSVPQIEPPQLIEGVLHQEAKMVIGGASKSRKTWTLIDLMLSVGAGQPWWGFATMRGRVLYVNFELPAFAFEKRIRAIAGRKAITDFSGFDVWNLRGFATDFSELIPMILARISEHHYALIILDPVYKGLGNRDENKAGDIASLCNEIERLAVQSGAAVVFGAHYSKGNQAGKESIDRIGGSGVFARDPDVILTMTSHEDEEAYVVDLTLRALPPVSPFVVRWTGVQFERDDNADASCLRVPNSTRKPRKPAGGKYKIAGMESLASGQPKPPGRKSKMNGAKLQKALVAAGGKVGRGNVEQIAKKMKVSARTIWRWVRRMESQSAESQAASNAPAGESQPGDK